MIGAGQQSSIVGNRAAPGGPETIQKCKTDWKKCGASPATFSNGVCGRRGRLRPQKRTISGPEALLLNLKYMGLSYLRLVTHFNFLFVGPNQKMVTEWP